MHNHDGDKQNSRMMWVMMLCCILPFMLIFIFGVGGKELGAPTWVIFGGIAAMAVIHLFMMGKSHKYPEEGHEITDGENEKKEKKDDQNHSGHDCCY